VLHSLLSAASPRCLLLLRKPPGIRRPSPLLDVDDVRVDARNGKKTVVDSVGLPSGRWADERPLPRITI
jgi:hypothetical protein